MIIWGKRVTKSPKLYFYDVGLAATLMGIDKEIISKKRDIYGALFENMIIVDFIKNCNAHGIRNTLTFFRDSNKKEIDLIIESGDAIIPVEIKAYETMQSSFFDTLTWFQEQKQNVATPVVIYGGEHTQKRTRGNVIPWLHVASLVTVQK